MIKLLFFDWLDLEFADGFSRVLEQPRKCDAPLFVADQPWENGNMQLYGTVVRPAAGPFQMWYSCIQAPWTMYLAYAESDDGRAWRRPLLDIHEHEGRKTNIVVADDPHGPAVIYDPRDPDPRYRYKMLAGARPSDLICAYHSPDGRMWRKFSPRPAILTPPDCPIGLFRARDGRYAAFHRIAGLGRRVWRSESWDFEHWSEEPRLVLEPDGGDGCGIQFYGFGAAPYGDYELGTLWMYHTERDDTGPNKMRGYQEAELTYARAGGVIHRAAPGQPFIPHGAPGAWDQGNLQCSSQPVFLDDEIRYYYMGTNMSHDIRWELKPQRAGLGYASLKPDRFVALDAGEAEAALLTMPFIPAGSRLHINAATKAGGWIAVEVLDRDRRPLAGYGAGDAARFSGDSVQHEIRWGGRDLAAFAAQSPVRLRIGARRARLYSLFNSRPDERIVYHEFDSLYSHIYGEREQARVNNADRFVPRKW